jgi:flagellar biosynthesis protein FlhG
MNPKQKLDQAHGLRALLAVNSNNRLLCFFVSLPATQKNALLINLAYAVTKLNKSVHLIDVNQPHNGISSKSRSAIAPLLFNFTSAPQMSSIASYDDGILISKLTDAPISQISKDPIKTNKIISKIEAVLEDSDLSFLDIQLDDDSSFLIGEMLLSEMILITTPTAEAIKATYLQLKLLSVLHPNCHFSLMIMDGTQSQAEQAYANLQQTAQQYLNLEIKLLGILPHDPYFLSAVQAGKTVIDTFPNSSSTIALMNIAKDLIAEIFETGNSSLG